MLGTNYNIATLNIRGTKKPGVRDEVEKWMTSRNIKILCLQETRTKENTRETRKKYTWFFSGEGGNSNTYTPGVAIIIHNNFLQYIEDIEPISDRLMYITLKGTFPITIISAYMPQSDRPYEEKVANYEKLQKIVDKKKNKGPLYIMGDWNARLIYPTTEAEEAIMGKKHNA